MSTGVKTISSQLAAAIEGPQITAGQWTVAAAYKFCERLARAHYENFPVGSVLVPRPLRKHFYSIYAFARTADDFADEGYDQPHSNDERLALLDEWRRLLRASEREPATHPIFIALAETRRQFDLPLALFEDLLSAFSQDVTKRRYQTEVELIDYCRRSANPIGRLILLLFGYRDEQLHRWSDDICTALQLANHWQDLAIDLAKDRIYLPAEDLARFGLTIADIERQAATEKFVALMQHEVKRARELFIHGKPLCLTVSGRLGLELRAVWTGGTRILDRIEAARFDVFTRRPVITTTDKLRVALNAASKSIFRRR
ncbi:MAG TPA: squalene synthase HpnC [Blastocatellia bacterium]|nr:squalene synthase HpnC [Blastocatellia bacterium]